MKMAWKKEINFQPTLKNKLTNLEEVRAEVAPLNYEEEPVSAKAEDVLREKRYKNHSFCCNFNVTYLEVVAPSSYLEEVGTTLAGKVPELDAATAAKIKTINKALKNAFFTC